MVKNEYTHFCVTESLSNHGERFFTSYYEFCIKIIKNSELTLREKYKLCNRKIYKKCSLWLSKVSSIIW